MDLDTSLLKQFLFWIVGGVGAAAITYYVFENVSTLADLNPKVKRYLSLAVAAALAMAAFAGSVGLGYFEIPVGWQGWLEALFAVAFVAVGGSQWIHGSRKLEG